MLLVDPGQVMNSTTNEGTNTGCHFEDENISNVGSRQSESVARVDPVARGESAAGSESAVESKFFSTVKDLLH